MGLECLFHINFICANIKTWPLSKSSKNVNGNPKKCESDYICQALIGALARLAKI